MKKILFVNFVTQNGLPESQEAITSKEVCYAFERGGFAQIVFSNGIERQCTNSLFDLTDGIGLISIGVVTKLNNSVTSIGEVSVNTDYVSSIISFNGGSKVIVQVPNSSPSSMETSKTIQEIQLESLSQFGNTAVPVFQDLSAQGSTISTTSVMEYGVNTFTSATSTNYATKLPQPQTGRKVTIINNSGYAMLVFPSNVGGTINNLGDSQPIVIPSDKVSYEFTCVENPNPGAWIVTPPAISQYDSGEVSISSIDGTTSLRSINIVSTAESNLVSFTALANEWSEDGINKPPVGLYNISSEDFYVKIPQTPWNGISKVKVYTNLSATQNMAGNSSVEVRLINSAQFNQYTIGGTLSSDLVNSYGIGGSNPMVSIFTQTGVWNLSNSIGTPAGSFGDTLTNIGDAGTRWGEFVYGAAYSNSNTSYSKLGNHFVGQLPLNGVGSTPPLYDTYFTGAFYILLRFNNFNATISNFKARVFVEFF
jgi:hypothetical protein